MRPEIALQHEFVDVMPPALQEHTLYVSLTYNTAVHNCLCGCGRKVVTPLSPAAWRLTYDGRTVSLEPSVGNWTFPCRSHYLITHSRGRWAGQWSREMVDVGRSREAMTREHYYAGTTPGSVLHATPQSGVTQPSVPPAGFWQRLWRRFWG